jgi:hypothetical protein
MRRIDRFIFQNLKLIFEFNPVDAAVTVFRYKNN